MLPLCYAAPLLLLIVIKPGCLCSEIITKTLLCFEINNLNGDISFQRLPWSTTWSATPSWLPSWGRSSSRSRGRRRPGLEPSSAGSGCSERSWSTSRPTFRPARASPSWAARPPARPASSYSWSRTATLGRKVTNWPFPHYLLCNLWRIITKSILLHVGLSDFFKGGPTLASYSVFFFVFLHRKLF